jgi:hypothetical protein
MKNKRGLSHGELINERLRIVLNEPSVLQDDGLNPNREYQILKQEMDRRGYSGSRYVGSPIPKKPIIFGEGGVHRFEF